MSRDLALVISFSQPKVVGRSRENWAQRASLSSPTSLTISSGSRTWLRGPLAGSSISYRMAFPSSALPKLHDCADCGDVVHTDGADRAAVTADRGRRYPQPRRAREPR